MAHYAAMPIDHNAIRARVRQRIDASPRLTVRNVSLTAFGSDSALHKFLTGANETIRLSNLSNLAEALGVSLAWLLFERELADGDGPSESFTEDVIAEMVSNALEEIQPGMTLAEIRPVVASSLHEQLGLHLAGGSVPDLGVERIARGKVAQSLDPTNQSEKAVSRTA